MAQRMPEAWRQQAAASRPLRLLVEDADPALALSDFSEFREAGFLVALCPGPGRPGQDCPALEGRRCQLLEGADVVLSRLDPAIGLERAIHELRPELPVVAVPPAGTGRRADSKRRPGELSARSPVPEQIRVLRAAAFSRPHRHVAS